MGYYMLHTQQATMPKIDLTRIKDMTEEEWKSIVIHVPFLGNPFGNFLDYTDGSNLGRTNWVFKPRVYHSAKSAGLSLLRTLNFTCGVNSLS